MSKSGKVKLKRVGGGSPLHVWDVGLVKTGQEIEVSKEMADGLLALGGEFEPAEKSKPKAKKETE